MAPGIVRRPAKRVFRSFGLATSELRPLPDFLIIGAHRAGTTSLHGYLEQHPCVARKYPRLQYVKGVRYFDANFFRGVGWYRSHFPTAAYRGYLRRRRGGPILTGEASPYYLFHPLAAERARRVVPEAKIIVLLRDPVTRAHSHWKRVHRDGTEPLDRFEDALAAEPQRLAGEVERIVSDERYYSYAHENFSYVTQGLYVDALSRWLEHFPRERMYVATSERFAADPQGVFDEVLRFLDLRPFSVPDTRPLNTTDGRDQLDAATRQELRARVAPYNRRLEDLLGLRLAWDAEGSDEIPAAPGRPTVEERVAS